MFETLPPRTSSETTEFEGGSWPRREREGSPPPVLAIAGAGLSGSTLLCRMLGELPGFVAIGEVGRIWEKGLGEDIDCSCGRPFSACPFWTAVGLEAFGGWDRLDMRECRRLARHISLSDSRLPHPFALPRILAPWSAPRFRHDLLAYAESLDRVYGGVRAVSGADVIVDSMKIPAHIYMLATQDRFAASFVQLVRDPRGVAYSNTKEVPRQGSRADKPMRTIRTPAKSASKWLWFNTSFELLRALGHPLTRVAYEEMVRDPATTIRACAGHTGFPPSDAGLRFIDGRTVDLDPGHLVSGNRMRRSRGGIELRVDDAWRRELPPADRRTVERISFPLLRRYGYSPMR
jgi:hypothetical protein